METKRTEEQEQKEQKANDKKFKKGLKKSLNLMAKARDEYYNAYCYTGRLGDGTIIMDKLQEINTLFNASISVISRQLRIEIPIGEMEPLDDIGDLFTIEEFVSSVECGGFIDYDGYGYYATATEQSKSVIYPSDVRADMYKKEATHVKWYNR
mgnify:CR=1 FL=1|tara:strand:- start:52336 stop:52794 length:459 start_codon:yes stop_codon:yes gene_type:complete